VSATAGGLIEIGAAHNIYNLTTRTPDDVVDHCTRDHISFVPWFPVMNGALAGHHAHRGSQQTHAHR
jgi:pyridoxine 4-dehydrogenase